VSNALLWRSREIGYIEEINLQFWADATKIVIGIYNRRSKTLIEETPFEPWCGKKLDVSHLRVFCIGIFAHTP
jgi:hypothetical protein